jgi:hypothetical protein
VVDVGDDGDVANGFGGGRGGAHFGYVLFCGFGLGAGDREDGENARLVQFTAVGRGMPDDGGRIDWV